MSAYLDANILIAALVEERFTVEARAFLGRDRGGFITSNFALAECVSALGRLARMQSLSRSEVRSALSLLDAWVPTKTSVVEVGRADISAANATLRDFDLGLRAPDAINIAIAERNVAELATFDERMAKAARKLGVRVAKI